MGSLLDLDPVDHYHRQADVVQAAAYELGERRAGGSTKAREIADFEVDFASASTLDLGADRLVGALEAAAADPGHDPLEDEIGGRVAGGEVRSP